MPKAAKLPHLELFCFGNPAVTVGGKEPPADVLWRKHHALMVYLALSPSKERTRDHLMGMLWPEKPQGKARHSLNEAVRRLRVGLGDRRLRSQAETIGLCDESLTVDVETFETVAAEDPARAADLCVGEFLEGFSLDDAPDYDGWVLSERARLNALATTCLLVRAEGLLKSSEFAAALETAKKALNINMFLEPAANLAMRACALSGDATGALAMYHDFAERTRSALGEEPGKALQILSQRIRDGKWQTGTTPRLDEDARLVGRNAVYEQVFSLLDRALETGPHVLVIVGDPGMGKTRVLNDCAKRASLAGAVVATARPLTSDHDAPWSSLGLLMDGELGSAPGITGADPNALATLASFSQQLAERFEPSLPRDSAQVASALRSVFSSVADEQPLVVILDDAHLADGPSIEALGAAVKQIRETPIIVIVAADGSSERGSGELARLRGAVGRDVLGASHNLVPLKKEEIELMVAELVPWCATPDESDRMTRRVFYESGGSPFLAVTLLRGLANAPTLKQDLLAWPRPKSTYDSPLPFSIPDLARLAVIARISELDEQSLDVLRVASIGGIALDLDLVAALAGISGEALEQALDTLERHRFLVFDGVRYAFAAPLFAQAIRGECLTHGQRQRLRKRAIEELSRRTELESRVLRAELMAKAFRDAKAFEEAVSVARAALSAGADRSARRALFAAERSAGDDQKALAVLEELRTGLTV